MLPSLGLHSLIYSSGTSSRLQLMSPHKLCPCSLFPGALVAWLAAFRMPAQVSQPFFQGIVCLFSIDSWEVFIDPRHGSSLHIWIGLPFSLLENVFFDGQMFAANVVELIFVVCTLCVSIRIALPVA